jgi:hypothetical protein
MANSSEIQSQDLDIEIHKKTIQLVETYNEHSIQTVLQLLTDTICFATLSASFLVGKERLAILNSWIQELFYSLNDTMKAFCGGQFFYTIKPQLVLLMLSANV